MTGPYALSREGMAGATSRDRKATLDSGQWVPLAVAALAGGRTWVTEDSERALQKKQGLGPRGPCAQSKRLNCITKAHS